MDNDFDIIYGKNSVLEALNSGKREINKILISKNIHTDNKIAKIKEIAQSKGIVFQFAGKDKFQPFEQFNHQGVIAQISPIKYTDLDDFINDFKNKETYHSLVILDGVEDSHNLGAIIRTCVCAGVDGIIIPSRRNVLINSTIEKISEGAVNYIPIIKANSLVNAVQKLKENDWWIVSTDASAKENYYDVKYNDMNFALVMGAEHAGVSKSLLKASDFVVKIPMQNNFNSLNVSNAMSAVIFEALRQKLIKK
ncbi:MAG TPA: 23S rRNA (guanosine(2251)-2'-O)-methyltransferase RlmB [Cyanobacteria bacterium UBA11991]|nr:23S rRNA (guanosine(2251)-2'-O)-methyltransferase RlmB [Cyanobacteriota bacterium]MDY6358253.1 23S rRNA (guanosine(2251)-2'-O)-methyltransferase RlmB [Cyanobacteriota bacterium]MDY6363819.1 23S rRNA (guanosine(2251)-2'-O)-methyltransferase RlmB [Cyanobacteriota bacterium]MDY6382351.1 23S rRNA (guanosine(2251)-2'-O)-methyltransferase RlmB [Cyanobacteriota bacterium]HCB10821.1 23S rRNA (guanosine(2251)-2'-O)-methyltransferase RlmB [Cyanobacteria bacterium UBA11991]